MQFKELQKRFFPSVNMVIRIGISLGLVLFFILCETERISVQFFKQLELLAYDTRLKLTLPNTIDPRIVIIDVDEKSLIAEGRWPWSRDKLALMIKNAFERNKVKVVGFDIVFAEPDETSGLKTLEQLAQNEFRSDTDFQSVLPRLRKDLDFDGKFAQRSHPRWHFQERDLTHTRLEGPLERG